MKTVDVIRRENLHILAKESGGPGGLSEDLEKSKSQISQWLNASPDSKTGKPRTIGNASAREIEQKKGKPTGWMDVDHSFARAAQQIDSSATGEGALAASPPHMEYVDSDNQERGAYYVLEGKASPQSSSAKNISPIFGYQITRSGEVEAIHSSVNALADKGLLDAEAIAAITALLHFIESKNNQQ